MNTKSNANLIRKSILSLGAVAAIALPLVVSANTAVKTNANYSLVNTTKPAEVQLDSEALYAKLQNISHDLCGSSDRYITGSLRKSAQVESCYEGTLTAAVERLDKPEVTRLHRN